MVTTYTYKSWMYREIPKVGIYINGTPVEPVGALSPVAGHAGWERGYKKQSGYPIVLQSWVYNGEVMHLELLSQATNPNQKYAITFDCHTTELWWQSGIAWSNDQRLQTVFAQAGFSTAHDSFYTSIFAGGSDTVDKPQTYDAGSPRMIYTWHAYVWAMRMGAANKRAGSEIMVSYMDEWMRIQVQRPYQWPNDDGTSGAYTTNSVVPTPSGLPGDLDIVYDQNFFGQNAWNHNHYTMRQLGNIHRLFGWPRALDQMVRLFWSQLHEKGNGYTQLTLTKGYGNSRAMGWILQAGAELLRVLYPLAVVYPTTYQDMYSTVLKFIAGHLNRAWGLGFTPAHYGQAPFTKPYAIHSFTSLYTKEPCSFSGNVIDHVVTKGGLKPDSTTYSIPTWHYGLEIKVVHSGGTCILRDNPQQGYTPTAGDPKKPIVKKSGVGTVVSGEVNYLTGEIDVTLGPGETISSAFAIYKHKDGLYFNYYPSWTAGLSGSGHNLTYPFHTNFMAGIVCMGMMQVFMALYVTGNASYVGPTSLQGTAQTFYWGTVNNPQLAPVANKAVAMAYDCAIYIEYDSWSRHPTLPFFYYDKDISGETLGGSGHVTGEALAIDGSGNIAATLWNKINVKDTLVIEVTHSGGSCVLVSDGPDPVANVQQLSKLSGAGTLTSGSTNVVTGVVAANMVETIQSATASYFVGSLPGVPPWLYDGMKRLTLLLPTAPVPAGFEGQITWPLSMLAFWEDWATPANNSSGVMNNANFDWGNIDAFSGSTQSIHLFGAWLDPANSY